MESPYFVKDPLIFSHIHEMERPPLYMMKKSLIFQSSSVLHSRMSFAGTTESDTFASNSQDIVTANDNQQLLVGSIINPRGFSKEGTKLRV